MKKTAKKGIIHKAQTIPVLELDAPLAIDTVLTQKPIVDTVMVRAQKKWIGGVALFSLFLMSVLLVLNGYYANSITNSEPSDPTIKVPTPTPTLKPTLFPIRIAVWNGSGVGGLAKVVGDELKSAGYNVVEINNAPQTQTGTTLLMSSSAKDRETELQKVFIQNNRTITSVETLTRGEYDVLIILGR